MNKKKQFPIESLASKFSSNPFKKIKHPPDERSVKFKPIGALKVELAERLSSTEFESIKRLHDDNSNKVKPVEMLGFESSQPLIFDSYGAPLGALDRKLLGQFLDDKFHPQDKDSCHQPLSISDQLLSAGGAIEAVELFMDNSTDIFEKNKWLEENKEYITAERIEQIINAAFFYGKSKAGQELLAPRKLQAKKNQDRILELWQKNKKGGLSCDGSVLSKNKAAKEIAKDKDVSLTERTVRIFLQSIKDTN